MALARRFVAAGARWLHVVDLDAARTGRPVNRSTVLAIAAAVGRPGRRSAAGCAPRTTSIELLAGGVSRVVLGTVAVDEPGMARRLAARSSGSGGASASTTGWTPAGRTEVAVRGWEQGERAHRGRAARTISTAPEWPR